MKKLSILTAVAAISCVTLIVACGQNRDHYRGRYGTPPHCSYDRGFNQYDRGFDRYNRGGFDRYDRGGYDRGGYDRGGYDPTCTGGIRHPGPHGCGRDDYRAWHHTSRANFCMYGEIRFGGGHSVTDSDEAEIILCNLNEEPNVACPQGLTCQAKLEGDTGICL